MRARKRAGRRCAQPDAQAPPSLRELLASVEVDEVDESGPMLETPDIFEPDPEHELPEHELPESDLPENDLPENQLIEDELELESEAPSRTHSPLARALAVAVDVEAACEASNNAQSPVVPPSASAQMAAPAQMAPPKQTRQHGGEPEEEPPFDAPDEDDDIFRPPPHARRWSDPADVLELHMPAPPSFPHEPTEIRPPARPAPAISIHVNWDRTAGAALAEKLACEPLLARADISDARGGIGGAAAHLAKINPPDLLILETTLKAGPLLQAVDALQGALAGGARLLIVGDVNDVTLLRDLARRGIIHYFLAPADPHEIARAICDLYADADKSRVVAVIGSRGGVGASTIAHNLAWSLAERTDASTTLIELDLAFGTTAFGFDQRPAHSVADGVRDPQSINESFLDRVSVMQTERLRLIAAPATLGDTVALERAAVGALIRNARRISKVVVLDVPHHWDACIKDVLERANDVLIVATPDLASLRNTKNMLDVLKTLRPGGHEPMVLLSMVGASKASEISEKDFTGAIGAKPIMAFEFDPALVAGSALKRQMLGEAAPQSSAARQIDDLSVLLTARKMVKRRKRSLKPQPQHEAQHQTQHATQHAETLSVEAPPAPAPTPDCSVSEKPPQLAAPSRPDVHFEPTPARELTPSTPPTQLAPLAPCALEQPKRRPRPLLRRQLESKPARKRAAPQPGTLRLTAALMALLAASMWYVEKRTDLNFIGYVIAAPR